jgi:hypothetical protein
MVGANLPSYLLSPLSPTHMIFLHMKSYYRIKAYLITFSSEKFFSFILIHTLLLRPKGQVLEHVMLNKPHNLIFLQLWEKITVSL